jgi:hypothetical protein
MVMFEQRLHVDVPELVESFERVLLQRGAPRRARVVDEDVQPLHVLGEFARDMPEAGRLGQVRVQRDALAGCGQFGGPAIAGLLLPRHDVHAAATRPHQP